MKKTFGARGFVVLSYFLLALIYLAVGFSPKPAEAAIYDVSAEISIPAISLTSDVTAMTIRDGNLDTPDTIVGSFSHAENKIFLVGHRSGVFKNLNRLKVGDEIIYNDETYIVKETTESKKSEISMNELLRAAEIKTLVVMTCAGENLPNGDATHRLIITATR